MPIRVLQEYLTDSGWVASRRAGRPVDSSGDPLPWLTYPAIRFLQTREGLEGLDVLEFGAGYSTLWWSKRVKSIFSVEPKEEFAQMVIEHKAFRPNIVVQVATIKEWAKTARVFDICVVDTLFRFECAAYAAERRIPAIILDNAERDSAAPIYDLLASAGYKNVPFWGIGPCNNYEWLTTIFYLPDNALAL